jgi:PAS domain S-box-containing protein
MVDASGTIVFANAAATRVFGYATGELIGLPVDVLLPERLRGVHVSHRADYLAAAVPRPMGADRDLVALRKDGAEIPIEVALGTLERDAGRLVVSFVADISQRRDADKRIHEYKERLEAMAFDAAVTEERERRRIAIDLHDRIGQGLALAQIKLTSVREASADAVRGAIDEAIALLSQSIGDTRSLTFELSPPVLYDLGLREALNWLSEDIEQRHGIRIEIDDDAEDKPLDDMTSAFTFRAVRELLMNVIKHAKSPTATVTLHRRGASLAVDVSDQGVGFVPDSAAVRAGFGLMSVREQLRRLGGTVTIQTSPMEGTKVSLNVPLKVRRPTDPPPTPLEDSPR